MAGSQDAQPPLPLWWLEHQCAKDGPPAQLPAPGDASPCAARQTLQVLSRDPEVRRLPWATQTSQGWTLLRGGGSIRASCREPADSTWSLRVKPWGHLREASWWPSPARVRLELSLHLCSYSTYSDFLVLM